MSISISPKDDNKDVRDQSFIIKYNEDEAKDVVSHILIQYNDYSFDAQYQLFLTISKIGLKKKEFGILCNNVRKSLDAKSIEQNALMEYHVDHVMPREHTKMVSALVKKWNWYFTQWEKEAYKKNPDLTKITRLDGLIHRTMQLLTEFNLGTNVILFIQKKMQKLESSTKTLNITDLNNVNKYDNSSNNLDKTVNELSTTVKTTPETGENEPGSSDGSVIPKIEHE